MKNEPYSDRALCCPGSDDPSQTLADAKTWPAEKCRTLAAEARENPDKKFRLFNLTTDWRNLLDSIKEDHRDHSYPEVGAEPLRTAQELSIELREGRYRPSPLFERPAPDRGDGRFIVTLKPVDAIVQRAMVRVLEAVVEPRLSDISLAYRQHRGGRDVLERVSSFIAAMEGEAYAVRLDVAKCYPSISRRRLTRALKKHVRDTRFIELVHLMLGVAVRGPDGKRRPSRGIAEGAVLSPLLLNLFLDQVDVGLVWDLDADILKIRYADDILLIVPGSRARAEQAAATAESLLARLDLRVNPHKTLVASIDEAFDFVGYRFQRVASPTGTSVYVDVSDKSVGKFLKRLVASQPEPGESDVDYRRRLEASMASWLSGRPLAGDTEEGLRALIGMQVERASAQRGQKKTVVEVNTRRLPQVGDIERRWALVEPDFPGWQTDPSVFSERRRWVQAQLEYFGARVSEHLAALAATENRLRQLALRLEQTQRGAGATRFEREYMLQSDLEYQELDLEIIRIRMNLIILEARRTELLLKKEFLSRYRAFIKLEMQESGCSPASAARRIAVATEACLGGSAPASRWSTGT